MDLFEGNKRGGKKDGVSGALRGTRGDPTNQEYQNEFEKGRFVYEKNKYGETAARVLKYDRDRGHSSSEKNEKPEKEEYTYRSEPNFYRRDNDKSHTTRDKHTGKYPEETRKELPAKSSAASVFAIICAFSAFIFIVFIWGANMGEKTTNIGDRIETEVFKKIWPAYETSAENTERLKAEKERGVRLTKDLNRRLAKWIETSILPRYRKTEIDRAMPFHYFDYNRRGSHITAKVGVPFRVDGCFTYWGNFLCYSSNNGITWKVQWTNQDDHTTRALLKQKERG